MYGGAIGVDGRATAVVDIGKTNVKLVLIGSEGAVLAEHRRANTIVTGGPYPHHDTEGIWNWMLTTLRHFSTLASIGAIVPVTHGATAALADEEGLVLPVLDYEAELPVDQVRLRHRGAFEDGERTWHADDYRAVRPAFSETLSPELPAGLNLARQLHWLEMTFPAEFSLTRYILTYPQYWAWRLSGVAASEVTSLGCHTDLWNPQTAEFSTLVGRMGWTGLFPPLRKAWDRLGPLLPALAAQLGLPADCQVLCGIHDSNASLLRHLDGASAREPVTVLSTGTWVIAAALGRPLDRLREQADMLANVTASGHAVACMRFMGGREFSALAGPNPLSCTLDEIAALVGRGTLAVPCFADSGGAFVGKEGWIAGPAPRSPREQYALATLYCVLMTGYCLDALGAQGPVVVEGSFTDNPFFASLLATLRGQQPVYLSGDTSGTTCGGWMLHHRGRQADMCLERAAPLELPGWDAYRQRWLGLAEQMLASGA
ncbi:L-fuculose kinase [Oxalobacteraceae bacterium]|nr:L-fuculose kinase [Oxalobacteraceae bacterium]